MSRDPAQRGPRHGGEVASQRAGGLHGALGSWVRAHPRLVDGVVALLVFTYNLPIQVGAVWHGIESAAGVLLSVGACAPWVFRRDRPMAVFVVMVLASFLEWLLAVGPAGPMPAAVLVLGGVYNLAVRCGRRWSVGGAAVLVLGVVAVLAGRGGDWLAAVADLVFATVVVAAVWMWGYTVRTRHAYVGSLQERAAQLERERDQQARIAAASERARIAREIHDIVSHSLSVVVVMTEGAATSVRRDPERTERALRTVSDTGRGALAEMRRMLDVLREDEPGSHAPQPGVARMEELIAQGRAAGSPVELTVRGTPTQLPAGTDLAVYRIVQEALTNTRKHAGPGVSRVQVQLSYGEEEVEVRVIDDGRGLAAPASTGPGGGRGLLGMEERVGAYGGVLRTGPRVSGGFEVVARLPVGRTK